MESEITGRRSSSKKKYTKPCLRAYGTVESITRAHSRTNQSGDNPTKRNHRTGG